jgi:hypothetical protein
MTRALRAVILQSGGAVGLLRHSVSRQCAGKLPGYRTAQTRFGDVVGASRLSPFTRLGISPSLDAPSREGRAVAAPGAPLRTRRQASA